MLSNLIKLFITATLILFSVSIYAFDINIPNNYTLENNTNYGEDLSINLSWTEYCNATYIPATTISVGPGQQTKNVYNWTETCDFWDTKIELGYITYKSKIKNNSYQIPIYAIVNTHNEQPGECSIRLCSSNDSGCTWLKRIDTNRVTAVYDKKENLIIQITKDIYSDAVINLSISNGDICSQ